LKWAQVFMSTVSCYPTSYNWHSLCSSAKTWGREWLYAKISTDRHTDETNLKCAFWPVLLWRRQTLGHFVALNITTTALNVHNWHKQVESSISIFLSSAATDVNYRSHCALYLKAWPEYKMSQRTERHSNVEYAFFSRLLNTSFFVKHCFSWCVCVCVCVYVRMCVRGCVFCLMLPSDHQMRSTTTSNHHTFLNHTSTFFILFSLLLLHI
jgi:hypothetical protein